MSKRIPPKTLADPTMRAKALANRVAAQRERGCGFQALITLALIERTQEALGRVMSPAEMHELRQGTGPLPSENSRYAALVEAGYLARTGNRREGFSYQMLKAADPKFLRAKDKRAIDNAMIRFEARQGVSPTASIEAIPAALAYAMKALKPFAAYGRKIDDGEPDTRVPLLMRGDGLYNLEFRQAARAYAKLVASLGEPSDVDMGEEAGPHAVSQGDDMERFFGA